MVNETILAVIIAFWSAPVLCPIVTVSSQVEIRTAGAR